jgi:hypothetical protein
MIHFAPLWADGEWLKLIVPIVMFSVWVLNRLLGGDSPAAKQAKARQQARAKPPQPPADKQRVEDEVGEFLRRAAQQRAGKDNRALAPANQPLRPPKPSRKSLAATSPDRPPAAPEPVRAAGKPGSLAASTADAFGDRKLTERVVGPTDVQQAVDAMQSHVAETFGHRVGSLAGSARSEPAPANAPASAAVANEVAAMLRDPQSIREAIVISEILRRPVERW